MPKKPAVHLEHDVTWPVEPYKNAYCDPRAPWSTAVEKLVLTADESKVTCKRCKRCMA